MTALLIILGGLCAATILLYLYAVKPGKRRDISPFDRIPCAHRGLHDRDAGIPENSLAAFRAARQNGYGVELDIQFTADRQIVVFHDKTLTRMCGVDRRVDALTYTEIQELTLGNTQERIPLLQDVLRVLVDTPIICEIKSHGALTDTSLCAAAQPLLDAYAGPLCVESFNPFMMRWFRLHSPRTARGILSMVFDDNKEVTPAQGFLLTSLLTNFLCRPDFIAFQHTDKQVFSFRVCRQLFRAHTIAWTIQSTEDENASKDSFDTIIFENYYPDIQK